MASHAAISAICCLNWNHKWAIYVMFAGLALVFEAVQSTGQGLRQLFLKVGMTIENNILEVFVEGFVSLIFQIGDIDKITT